MRRHTFQRVPNGRFGITKKSIQLLFEATGQRRKINEQKLAWRISIVWPLNSTYIETKLNLFCRWCKPEARKLKIGIQINIWTFEISLNTEARNIMKHISEAQFVEFIFFLIG